MNLSNRSIRITLFKVPQSITDSNIYEREGLKSQETSINIKIHNNASILGADGLEDNVFRGHRIVFAKCIQPALGQIQEKTNIEKS